MRFRAFLCIIVPTVLLSANLSAAPLFTADEPTPADAVILFDGKDISGWVDTRTGEAPSWKVEDGYMEVRGGNIRTRQSFGDFQLHLEFWLPMMEQAAGQGRANSGVYLQGIYEVQVLDSYGVEELGTGDCGGIYGVAPPMVNACRPPGHWQSFDILFRAARLDEGGKVASPARVTVLHNGVLIQENAQMKGATPSGLSAEVSETGPIMLQDHGNPVRFRNIWIRSL